MTTQSDSRLDSGASSKRVSFTNGEEPEAKRQASGGASGSDGSSGTANGQSRGRNGSDDLPSPKRSRQGEVDGMAVESDVDNQVRNHQSGGAGGMSFILWPPVGEGTTSADPSIDLSDLLFLGSRSRFDKDGIYHGSIGEVYSPPRIAPVAEA